MSPPRATPDPRFAVAARIGIALFTVTVVGPRGAPANILTCRRACVAASRSQQHLNSGAAFKSNAAHDSDPRHDTAPSDPARSDPCVGCLPAASDVRNERAAVLSLISLGHGWGISPVTTALNNTRLQATAPKRIISLGDSLSRQVSAMIDPHWQ